MCGSGESVLTIAGWGGGKLYGTHYYVMRGCSNTMGFTGNFNMGHYSLQL